MGFFLPAAGRHFVQNSSVQLLMQNRFLNTKNPRISESCYELKLFSAFRSFSLRICKVKLSRTRCFALLRRCSCFLSRISLIVFMYFLDRSYLLRILHRPQLRELHRLDLIPVCTRLTLLLPARYRMTRNMKAACKQMLFCNN